MVTADFGQHVLAVRALLEAAGVTVHVGDVTAPDPAMPYVMLQIPPGVPFDVSVAAERVEFAGGDGFGERVTPVSGEGLGLDALEQARRQTESQNQEFQRLGA